MTFNEKVYEAVRKIPLGKVATYGQIALLAGNPRASRAVGWALHHNPQPIIIPCHRVVDRYGNLTKSFAFGGIEEQRRLLEDENVCVKNGTVDLTIYRWNHTDHN